MSPPSQPLPAPVAGAARLTLVRRTEPDAAGPAPQELAAWVQAVALQADRDAFARLFRHFAPRVKGYLLRGGTEEAQAEELAQETLLLLWRKAALFDARQAAVSTWVFTIARNLRVDRLRRQGLPTLPADQDDLDAVPDDAPGPEERLHAAVLHERVRVALRGLPPEQARVLQLSYFDDQPHASIASALGIPLGTVKSRMRLAVAHLRRALGAVDESEP